MSTRQLIPSKSAAVPFPSFTPVRSGLLQRKCACGGTPGLSGECEECNRKRLNGQQRAPRSLQTKLAINEPGDRFEQEADRMADFVMSGRSARVIGRFAVGSVPSNAKKRSRRRNRTTTMSGKENPRSARRNASREELKAKAAAMGKDFLSSIEGKVIAGSALGGALAAIIATNSSCHCDSGAL
jgi:hypothetical protein